VLRCLAAGRKQRYGRLVAWDGDERAPARGLFALGRYSEAEAAGRKALAHDADNYLAASRLAWTLFSLKRYADAAKMYARVLTLYPSDLEMMTGLGYSELRAGRKREASDAFRAVLGILPNHARAREGLAACR